MEIKLKRSTYFSLLFFGVVITIYFLSYFIDRDLYRKLLSFLSLYLFYPSLLIAVYFSVKSLILASKNNVNQKIKWIVLNSFSIIFALYFVIKMILVVTKVNG